MNTFTIDPTSLSYRFLCKVNSKYRYHKKYNETPAGTSEERDEAGVYRKPKVAHDFCTYWRAVLIPFVLGLFALGAVACAVFFWVHIHWLSEDKIHGPWYEIGFFAVGLIANLIAFVGIGATGIIHGIEKLAVVYGSYIAYKERNLPRDEWGDVIHPYKAEKKTPIRDFCSTAYAAYKENFCPIVAYSNESEVKIVDPPYHYDESDVEDEDNTSGVDEDDSTSEFHGL